MKGTCTGSEQQWLVELTDESGLGDGCYARLRAGGHTKIRGEHRDHETALAGCIP